MARTRNLALEKPELTDLVRVKTLNENMEKIDAAHGRLLDSLSTTAADIKQVASEKQNKLVSGSNIKTVNGVSLLGSGNISISGGGGSTSDSVIRDIDNLKSGKVDIYQPAASVNDVLVIDSSKSVTTRSLTASDVKVPTAGSSDRTLQQVLGDTSKIQEGSSIIGTVSDINEALGFADGGSVTIIKSINGKAPQPDANGNLVLEASDIEKLDQYINEHAPSGGEGTVKSVNNKTPDSRGNITIAAADISDLTSTVSGNLVTSTLTSVQSGKAADAAAVAAALAGKAPTNHTHDVSQVTNAVPTSRTINGKSLTGNITLGPGDITLNPGDISGLDTYIAQHSSGGGTGETVDLTKLQQNNTNSSNVAHLQYFVVNGLGIGTATTNGSPDTHAWHIVRMNRSNGNYRNYIDFAFDADEEFVAYRRVTNSATTGWHRIYDDASIVYSAAGAPSNPFEGMIWLEPVPETT